MSDDNVLEWEGGRLDFSSGCVVMGILNVTPDSFSDGGKFVDADSAVAHGVEMARAGAAIIDIGAESTRPGAEAVSTEEQIARSVSVIERLAARIDVPISIDAKVPAVAEAALNAGAAIINDVSALSDEDMAKLAAERKVPVVLMHMKGTPADMQKAPEYDDVVGEVYEYLIERAVYAESFGIEKRMIFIDPGIGFGKTFEHNLQLLGDLERFVASGYRVLVGTSRKRFIGQLTGKDDPAERVFGTAATVALSVSKGVSIVRVHDVGQMHDVVRVANALR